MTLAKGMFHAFRGYSHLPVFECDKTDIQTLGARVRPLRNPPNKLSFRAWRLAHAVKKADCAKWPSAKNVWLGTAGFLLEHLHLFDWSPRQLRLNPGMAKYYADVTRTSLSGRVAQGMALLFVEDQGYSFQGHFETVYQQYVRKQPSRSRRRRPGKRPDFILENGSRETALAEAKGKFVPPGSTPDIKAPLRDALNQLDSGRCISPRPPKSYAVGTFIREAGDCSAEPSLIAFVDPEPEEPQEPVEIPPDAIRRANYAPWLSLMGFDETARRLLAREGGSQSRVVPALTLGRNQYVFTIASILSWYGPWIPDRERWELIRDCPERLFGLCPGSMSLEIVGLDVRVVRALEMAIRGAQSEGLMDIEPGDRRDATGEFDGEGFHGSVFSDGSLLGELRIRRRYERAIEWLNVEL